MRAVARWVSHQEARRAHSTTVGWFKMEAVCGGRGASGTACSEATQLREEFPVAFIFSVLLWTLALALGSSAVAAAERPNIVVILTDDQGYADIGINPQHAAEVSTPHMDALAQAGVVFSQAYTSGHVCSPTRAGLMLGDYSQSVGVYTAGDGGRGFDPTKKIFPGFLPEEYVSMAIGKWHLGLDEDFPELKWHAMNRGFDECYKFMGRGGHSYFDLRSDSQEKFSGPIYRNLERIQDEGYLTTRLTEEACAFIDRHQQKPFFLYLAYNAVHAPAPAAGLQIVARRRRDSHTVYRLVASQVRRGADRQHSRHFVRYSPHRARSGGRDAGAARLCRPKPATAADRANGATPPNPLLEQRP